MHKVHSPWLRFLSFPAAKCTVCSFMLSFICFNLMLSRTMRSTWPVVSDEKGWEWNLFHFFSLRREGAYDINFFWISDVIFKKGLKKIVKSRLHPSGQRSFVLSISCLQRMFIALTCSVCCVRAIPVSAARHKSGRCALVEHPIIARKKTGPMMLWPTFGPFIRILPWNNRSSVQSEYMVAYCAFITVLVV